MPARKLTPQAVVTTALALADRHRAFGALDSARGLARGSASRQMSALPPLLREQGDALPDAMVGTGCMPRSLPSRGQRPMAPRGGLRRRSVSVRQVLHAHPWALP